MADKKAFVFDTNFIIQNKELDVVLDKLKEEFTVYATQVSIDERIAQTCRALQSDFNEAELCKSKFAQFANIEFKKSFEEASEFYQKGMQSRYEEYFENRIIPFEKNGETLSFIIDRANKRLPPFSAAKEASDKGFKDFLLWLSLLNYFRDYGESTVVFLTDDKSAFRNHIEYLTNEFKEITGKTIEFKPNSYYKELITPKVPKATIEDEIPDVAQIRERINEVIYDLCRYKIEDDWGDWYWERYFSMKTVSNPTYAKNILDALPNIINTHIFEQRISAYDIFNFDGRLQNGASSIPIEALEAAHCLHKEIKDTYPSYLEQFYLSVSNILNYNYDKTQYIVLDDDDLPF